MRITFWRKRPSKKVWKLPDMANFVFPEHIMVYVIGFSYDDVTAQMLTWLRGILVSRKVNQDKIVRFNESKESNKEDLAKSLEDKTTRIELFCGHGCHTGLFGPRQMEVAGSILGDRSFVIYDSDMITDTPSSMFAFCCQSANTFGRVFSSYKDKQFMGFKDDIPFPLELYEDLKYAFQTVVKDIIQKGRISSTHRDMFLDRLDEISSQSGEYQNPILVELWLNEYRKHLMLYA